MKTILVLTDFSEKAINAAVYAFHLATQMNADVLLFNARPLLQSNDINPVYQLEQQVAYLESLKQNFAPHYPDISYRYVQGEFMEHLDKIQFTQDISLIVIGEDGQRNFIERILARHHSAAIIEKAHCPVLIVGTHTRFKPFKDVTFACGTLDFVHLKAIDFVTQMMERFGAELDVVHISDLQNGEKALAEDTSYIQYVSAFKTFINYNNLTWHKLKGNNFSTILEKFTGFIDADLTCIIHQRHPLYDHLFQKSISKLLGTHKKPILIFPSRFESSLYPTAVQAGLSERS